jgi:hypothetical protein
MRGPPLNSSQLRRALSALAALLPQSTPAEMILIGGGAGMLSGLLPDGRQTVDVDVMDVTPPEGEAGGRGGQGAGMAKNKTAAMRAVVMAAHRGAELRCR